MQTAKYRQELVILELQEELKKPSTEEEKEAPRDGGSELRTTEREQEQEYSEEGFEGEEEGEEGRSGIGELVQNSEDRTRQPKVV